MPIVVTFDGRHLPVDAYDKVRAADPERVENQPERLHHVCYRDGDGFVVVDVWTTAEAFEEFGRTLGPAMAAVGIDIAPRVHELHAAMPGGGAADANVATVMAIYQAFGRGDVGFILDQLDDDVAWERGAEDHGVPWLQPGRGHDHVRRFFTVLAEQLELTVFEPGPPLANEHQVAVPVTIEARVRSTGKQVRDESEMHLWTFGGDGKVVAFNHVTDTHQHWLSLQP